MMSARRLVRMSLLPFLILACDGEQSSPSSNDPAGSSDPVDADGDGFIAEEDCDDADPAINADAEEQCDGIDNDCDGMIDDEDDDTVALGAWYADADGDGFGVASDTLTACVAPSGYVAEAGDCAPDDAAISPGEEEVCDSVDNDCSGVVDDAEALGSTAACAASDCVALRDIGDQSGVRWIDPDGSGAFEVWCEQDAGGGGWAALWTITGGAEGTSSSLTDIFSGAVSDTVHEPHWQSLETGVNQQATLVFGATPDVSLMKVSELFERDGTSVRYTELVAHLNSNTLVGLFTRQRPFNSARCDTLPDVIDFELADGSVQFGQTDQVWMYWNGSSDPQSSSAGFGVATINEADPSRGCSTTSDNLVYDPDNALRHPEGNPNESFSYWLGYRLDARDGQATRCLHHCWTSDWNGGRYDAVTWFARPSQ